MQRGRLMELKVDGLDGREVSLQSGGVITEYLPEVSRGDRRPTPRLSAVAGDLGADR